MSMAWASGVGDASLAESIAQVDAPIAQSFVEQASTALHGALAVNAQYEAEARQFITENGAQVLDGHEPVGMGAMSPANSAADPNPFTESSLNQGSAPAASPFTAGSLTDS